MPSEQGALPTEGDATPRWSRAQSSAIQKQGPTNGTELRRAALSGAAWKGMSQVVVQATRFALAVVLARLLTPTEFGIAGMVLVFATFVIPFADMGLGAAIVQRRVLAPADLSTVFWTSVAAGLCFTGIGVGISTLVARFYGVSEVAPLFAVLSASFIITALGATQRSLLVREIRFRSLELRAVAGLAVGAPAAVVVAAKGGGAWAFVTLELCSAATSTILLWALVPWRPTLSFSRQSLSELGSFGLKALGSRLFADIAQIGDKLLIGRFVGAGALGVYNISYALVLSPMTRIVGPIQEVLFPTMSRIQDERERLAAIWMRTNRVLAAFIFPALFGIILVAPEFVTIVLGQRWERATRIIQVLAWVGLLQALQGLNTIVLQARNRPGLLLRFTTVATITSLAAFVGGLPWGALGVAVAYAIAMTILTPAFMIITARELDIATAALLRSLAGVLKAALAMVAALLAFRLGLRHLAVPTSMRLVLLVLAGMLIYVPLLMAWCPQVFDDVRRLLPRVLPRN